MSWYAPIIVSSRPEFTIASSSVTLTNDWRSASLNFRPVATSMACSIRISVAAWRRRSMRPSRTCDRFFSHSKYDTVTPPALAIDVRNHHDPFLAKHVVGLGRRRAVGAFEDDLRLDARGVLACQHVFERGRDEHVAVELQRIGAAKNVRRAGKSEKRAGALAVDEDLLFVRARSG